MSRAESTKFIPVIFTDESSKLVPSDLKSATLFNLNNKEGFGDLFRLLTNNLEKTLFLLFGSFDAAETEGGIAHIGIDPIAGGNNRKSLLGSPAAAFY